MGLKTPHIDRPSLPQVELELPLYKDDLEPFPRRSHLRSRWPPFLLGLTTLVVWLVLFRREGVYVSTSRNPTSPYLIEARNGAVATENKRCSDIGVSALKDGGNAIDAAIAATFCSGVVNMFSWVS